MFYSRQTIAAAALLLGSVCSTCPAIASDVPKPTRQEEQNAKEQQEASDWSRGAVSGRVVDSANKPVSGATVALQDRDGKVIAWTKTGADGTYRVAADTVKVLRLEPSRRKNFLQQVAGAMGQVARVPGRVARGVIRDPGGTVRAAVTAGATGNPLPFAGMVGNAMKGDDKGMARSVSDARLQSANALRESLVSGEVLLLVNADGFKPLRDKAGAFWMEGPTYRAGVAPRGTDDKAPKEAIEVGAQAFLETAKLAPATGEGVSEIEPSAILLDEGGVIPVLAAAGTNVRVTTKVKTPPALPGRAFALRVFAREAKTGAFAELLKQKDGSYAGDVALDPQTPDGDTAICVVALRTEPVEVQIKRTEAADPLADFARDLEEMKPGKEYGYDPRIFAAENRLEIALTVLDPSKASPTAPAKAPVAAPTIKAVPK